MKFLLNVYSGGLGAPEEAFAGVLRRSGELVDGQVFAHPSRSAVVRVRDGLPLVTDGPHAGALAHATGYYVLDCESLARAVEVAALHPAARSDAVEIRPLMTSAGLEM